AGGHLGGDRRDGGAARRHPLTPAGAPRARASTVGPRLAHTQTATRPHPDRDSPTPRPRLAGTGSATRPKLALRNGACAHPDAWLRPPRRRRCVSTLPTEGVPWSPAGTSPGSRVSRRAPSPT